jgi:uncharacterized protein YmfQ (DUF2313 family)
MTDNYVKHSQDDYAEVLSELRPQGPAWPRDPDDPQMKTIFGLAGIWGIDVSNATDSFLTIESFPTSSINLLPEWEQSFGLPDKCLAEPLTISARHTALFQRMTTIGGQSRSFFIEEAAAIGYTITISEFRPFQVGIDRVGDNRIIGNGSPMLWPISYGGPLIGTPVLDSFGRPVSLGEYSDYPARIQPPTVRYYWVVHVIELAFRYFHCASGQCGVDPLLYFGIATDLECLIRRYKPGHTYVIFDYSATQ